MVFGHFIEPFRYDNAVFNALFVIIYAFHMPLFVFISGVLARFSIRRVIHIGIIYAMMQLAYLLFNIVAMGYMVTPTSIIKGLIYPFWHMWYLYAMLFWIMTLFIFEKMKNRYLRIMIFVFIVLISLLSGYYEIPFCLTRVITFYPFFILGYYLKDEIIESVYHKPRRKHHVICATALLGILISIGLLSSHINTEVLFSYQSYARGDYSIQERSIFFMTAVGIFLLIIKSMRSVQNKYLEMVGTRTMPIFLFHAFIYWELNQLGIHKYVSEGGSAIITFLYVIVCLVICVRTLSSSIFCNLENMLYQYEEAFLERFRRHYAV